MIDVHMVEKKCAICNKIIYPTPGWVYKIAASRKSTKWYCSYKCWRKDGGGNGHMPNEFYDD